MQSPNTPLRNENLTQTQMRTLSGSALDNAALGTMGGTAPIMAQLVAVEINPHLGWGDWLGIGVTRIAGTVIAAAIIFVALSAVWFDDTSHVLLAPLPLALTLLVAALVMRLCEENAALQRFTIPVLAIGIIVTALVLIRLFAFSELPTGDWSWLNSYQQLADPVAERPHTEWGMIVLSIVTWTMGVRLARFGGDYEKQRAAFFGFFVASIGAIILAVISVHGIDQRLGASLAVALPAYLFVGLLTLSQVRLAELRERLRATGSGDRRALTTWRITTIAFALLSLVSIVILGIVFYTGAYLRFIVTIFTPILTFVEIVLGFILWLLSPLISILTPQTQTTPKTPKCTSLNCIVQSKNQGLDQTAQHAIYIVAIIIIVLILVVSAFLVLRRLLRQGKADEFEEIQENLNPRDQQRTIRDARPARDLTFDVPAPGTVRAAYRDFLRNTSSAGLPRHPGETAAEFEQRVATEMLVAAPQTTPPVEAIDDLTQAYQEERYGAIAATSGRAAQARTLAMVVRRALPGLRQRLRTPPSSTQPSLFAGAEEIGEAQITWDIRPIAGITFVVVELALLHFLSLIPTINPHGIAKFAIYFFVGIGLVGLPVGAVVMGHLTWNNKFARWPVVTKALALIILVAGYMLLTSTIILGTLITLGAISNL